MHRLWSIPVLYPNFVSRLHTQTRFMCNFEQNGGIPWLAGTNGPLVLFVKAKLKI